MALLNQPNKHRFKQTEKKIQVDLMHKKICSISFIVRETLIKFQKDTMLLAWGHAAGLGNGMTSPGLTRSWGHTCLPPTVQGLADQAVSVSGPGTWLQPGESGSLSQDVGPLTSELWRLRGFQ